jgi:hypothetical protein
MTVDKAKLTRPFESGQIKQRPVGGGRSASYVEADNVRDRLNECLDEWNFRVVEMTTETVKASRWDGEGEDRQRVSVDVPLLKALVELEIPGLGKRQHMGVQVIEENAGEDLHKGAITDGLKKAAWLFGIGVDADSQPAQSQSGGGRGQGRTPNPEALAHPNYIAMLVKMVQERGGTEDGLLQHVRKEYKVRELSEMTNSVAQEVFNYLKAQSATSGGH